MPSSSNDLIKVGVIASAHGIRGQVKLRSLTENPKDLLTYSPLTDAKGARVFVFTCEGIKDDSLIVSIEGVADRNAAELLKNIGIYAPANLLPEKEDGMWYYSELVGMQAQTSDGKPYGKIIGVHNFGAGDILEFTLADGSNEMLPFKEGFIGDVHENDGFVVVYPPDYLEAAEDEKEA